MSAEAPRNTGTGELIPPPKPKGGFSGFLRRLFAVPSEHQPTLNSQIGVQIREMEDGRMRQEQEFYKKSKEKERQDAERVSRNFQKAREVATLSGVIELVRDAQVALTPYYRHVILDMDGSNPPPARYVNYLYLGSEQYSLSLNWSNTHYPNVRKSNEYDGSSITIVCNGVDQSIYIKGAEVKTLQYEAWKNREELERSLLEAVKRPEYHNIPSWTERA